MMSTSVSPQGSKVHVFVDFWNYELAMKGVDGGFKTDWAKLGAVLADAASNTLAPGAPHVFRGMSVHGSYNPSTEVRLFDWMTTVVGKFPGVRVTFSPRRRRRNPPRCPHCHRSVRNCPACNKDMRGTEEKGVDVQMAVDMISAAIHGTCDVAVIASSDRDFIPVAKFLSNLGIIVMHAAFGHQGSELSQNCWGSIDVPQLRQRFRR